MQNARADGEVLTTGWSRPLGSVLVALIICGVGATARAQDMEPRAYANTPVGINFLGLSYGYSTGSVGADPAVPLEDAKLDLHFTILNYARSFALLGQSAKVSAIVPYGWLSGSAVFDGMPVSREFSGLIDPVFKITANLLGAPALTLEEFPSYRQNWILGVSLGMSVPLGRYDEERLVNLGNNRWSFKPEIGVSKRWGPVTVDVAASTKFYTDNEEFFGDHTREQDPLYAVQTHFIYSLPAGAWAAFDATWYGGGQTTLDGKTNDDRQSSTRLGATGVMPLSRHFSVQIYASTGVLGRTGTDFDTVGMGLSYRWGGGL